MKRLVVVACMLVCIISFFGGFSNPSPVHAQPINPATGKAWTIKEMAEQSGLDELSERNNSVTGGELGVDAVGAASAGTSVTAAKPELKNVAPTDRCSYNPVTWPTYCLSNAITWFIKNTLLQIAGFLLWVTSSMLNYSIQVGILEFSKWAPDTLYPIWKIIRQIVSLFIVFIGLYLGFMYILGKDEKFKKYVPWVIMFALFVNFSYPLARLAVDISNIISLNLYTSTVGGSTIGAGTGAGGIIIAKLGLGALAASAVAVGNAPDVIGPINSIPGALAAVAFVLYAAYIFLIVTGIMIMRTIVLVFIIVASPLLFVDSVLPALGDQAMKLRKMFLEQLIVAPLFMLMLALTLKLMTIFSRTDGPLGAVSGVSGLNQSGDTSLTFFNILIMLVMLHIMIKVTKSQAGEFGNWAGNAMGKVGGFALGATTGGAGLLARQGIGGLAMKARDSGWVKNNQDSFIGRRAYNLSNSVANSTFDLRNNKFVAGKMDKIGMGMGMGRTLGQDAAGKAQLKDAQERGSRIKTRHERDVYKDTTDEKGKTVYEDIDDGKGGTKRVKTQELVHRKGEVDTDGVAAKNRFIANAGGGTMFLTKGQIQKNKEALGEQDNQETDKRIAEVKGKSSKDLQYYNEIKDKFRADGTKISIQEQKNSFYAELEKERETLKKTDPNLQGNQAQSLLQTINTLKEARFKEADAKSLEKFNKITRDVVAPDGTVSTKSQQRDTIIGDLKTDLERMRATDEKLESDTAQSLLKTIHSLEESKKSTSDAFITEVENTLSTYKRSAPEKRANILANKSEEVAKEVKKRLNESGVASASALSGQVRSIFSEKPTGNSVPLSATPMDFTIDEPYTPPVDFDMSKPTTAGTYTEPANTTKTAIPTDASNTPTSTIPTSTVADIDWSKYNNPTVNRNAAQAAKVARAHTATTV